MDCGNTFRAVKLDIQCLPGESAGRIQHKPQEETQLPLQKPREAPERWALHSSEDVNELKQKGPSSKSG